MKQKLPALLRRRPKLGSQEREPSFSLGRVKRHWSNVAIYTDDYEAYPFELDIVVVEAVYFSWDEMCDKFKAEQHKSGDYGVATIQGKPPVSIYFWMEALNK